MRCLRGVGLFSRTKSSPASCATSRRRMEEAVGGAGEEDGEAAGASAAAARAAAGATRRRNGTEDRGVVGTALLRRGRATAVGRREGIVARLLFPHRFPELLVVL